MSEALLPNAEARQRIQSLGQQAISAFFAEIPPPVMQQLARFLPSVHGFRKTSEAGIAKQKEILSRKLSRPGADNRDYHNLYMIWRAWIDANLPIADLAHELIDAVEDAAEDASGADERQTAIEKNVDSLLETLKEESHQNKCTREQIDRLFKFSPFPNTAASRNLLDTAKPATEVERDNELSELPKRLRQDEDQINFVKNEVKTLSSQLVSLAGSVETVVSKLRTFESNVAKTQLSVDGLQDFVSDEIKKAQVADAVKQDIQHNQFRLAIEARLQGAARQIEDLSNDLHQLATSLPDLVSLRETLESVATAQKKSEESAQANVKRIDTVLASLEAIELRVAQLTHDRLFAEHIPALEQRLLDLEGQQAVHLPARVEPEKAAEITTIENGEVFDFRSGPRWETLQVVNGASFPALQSVSEVTAAFTKALETVGVRKTIGQVFAEECASAVFCGQAVFLKGAFATRVARCLARAIAGPAGARVAIPIGLQDGEELRFCVSNALRRFPQHVGGLAIEGVNRVPIDLTREVIADTIERSFAQSCPLGGKAAIFATIMGGIASLPIEPTYFELGPVFDLDYLEWRTNPLVDSQPPANVLSVEVDTSIRKKLASSAASTEEAVRLAQLYPQKRNPVIERAFVQAYQALHAIRSDQQSPTPLQSLFYGWLLPYWRSIGLSKEQIDSELDGGKSNASSPDKRLSAMLVAEFPGAG